MKKGTVAILLLLVGTTVEAQPRTEEDKELYRQLVYNEREAPTRTEPIFDGSFNPDPEDRTPALADPADLSGVTICYQREVLYWPHWDTMANREWWEEAIRNWSNVRWSGPFVVEDRCEEWRMIVVGQPDGRIPPNRLLAGGVGRREGCGYWDRCSRWVGGSISFSNHPDLEYNNMTQQFVQSIMMHELGHVLGFHHVADHHFIMGLNLGDLTYNPREFALTQWAYKVGRDVPYPGYDLEDEPEPVPALPLPFLGVLGVVLVWMGLKKEKR